MEKVEILESLRKHMSNIFEVDVDEINATSKLVDDLDADSIDLLQLILGLKDEFGIAVSDGEVKQLLTELARFLPADFAADGVLSDAQLAEVTAQLTVSTIVDFVADRMGTAA